ncbi:MAG: 2,3-bisphosphoglycerate-dependent phosphoglycerate mutase [Nanoarchaeota archaeon]
MGKLVLIRHGESMWNKENRFTGWVDVSLSKKGIKEAKKAGKKLKNYNFDSAYTSNLIRAQQTLFEVLNINKNNNEYMRVHNTDKQNWYSNFKSEDLNHLLIYVSESLNERYYGDLQGKNKDEVRKKYSAEQVKIWRRSYDVAPPNGESLEMTSKRTLPYFKKNIVEKLKNGETIIVVAHGNSLRSIIMEIEKMSSDEILNFEIATGVPHIYEFDKKMNILYNGKI